MLDWERDKKWADGYGPQIAQILAENLGRIATVRTATDDEDATRATDLVVELDRGDVALRVRSATRFRDLTLRYRRRPWGIVEMDLQRGYEVDKILDGFARWYLYVWTSARNIVDWLIVDLDAVRDAHLIERAIDPIERREITNHDGVTTFTWLTFDELCSSNAVVNTTLGNRTVA